MKLGATAAMTDPARMTASETSSRRFLCGPSLSRPMTGVAMAPTSRLIVNIHWAVLTVTSNSRAIEGTSSMPNELTMAVHRAA